MSYLKINNKLKILIITLILITISSVFFIMNMKIEQSIDVVLIKDVDIKTNYSFLINQSRSEGLNEDMPVIIFYNKKYYKFQIKKITRNVDETDDSTLNDYNIVSLANIYNDDSINLLQGNEYNAKIITNEVKVYEMIFNNF